MPGRIPSLALAAGLVLAAAGAARAAWLLDGTVVASQSSTGQVVVSDGAGGVIAAWSDWRSASSLDIYAQRLDAYGRELWTAGGLAVCTAAADQQGLAMAADGAGGALLVWQDYRNGNADIYAQRLDAAGVALWTAGGLAISTSTSYEEWPDIAPDGSGGAFIVYARNAGTYDVWATHRNAAGAMMGHTNLGPSGTSERYPRVAPDAVGGAFVVWRDDRGISYDVYGQRIDAYCYEQWNLGGQGLCTMTGNQEVPRVINDGAGCAIVTWHDTRSGNYDVYALKLNGAGTPLWTSGGVPVSTAASNQMNPVPCSDGAEGAIITWKDDRSSVYAQRIGAAGAALWAADGAVVSNYPYGSYPDLVSDGVGGAIITWHCQQTTSNNIYAQRMSASGTALGPAAGIPLCSLLGDQQGPLLAPDGAGGAIVLWKDYRNQDLGGTYPQIYAQRLERNLYWGYPCPTIDAVRDVPGDQGGHVYVEWSASRLDPWPELLIERYTIWAAVDAKAALAALASGAAVPAERAGDKLAGDLEVIRREEVGATVHYWELVAELVANGYEHYSRKVATDFDSTGTWFAPTHYQVCAHAAAPAAWTSPPDSGYSVDNLAPAAPLGLAGTQIYDPFGLVLCWRANQEVDLAGYLVYRGASADFIPGQENLIASPADTTLRDPGASWAEGWWYKVAATDLHGNRSSFAVLGPADLTGSGSPPAVAATLLEPNRPNPFNPRTTIRFTLAHPGPIRLQIHAANGRLVRTLADGSREAGRHQVEWDGRDREGRDVASGIYFCRLAAGDVVLGRKLALVR